MFNKDKLNELSELLGQQENEYHPKTILMWKYQYEKIMGKSLTREHLEFKLEFKETFKDIEIY